MHSFKDATDREWNLKLTIGAVERVKNSIQGKPDLLNLAQGQPCLAALLEADDALRANVVFVICQPQAEGMAAADFCELLDGPTFKAATDALWDELLDFFQSLDRADIVELIGAVKQLSEKAKAKNQAQVKINVQNALSTSGNLSGAPPASPASIPDLSPSANCAGPSTANSTTVGNEPVGSSPNSTTPSEGNPNIPTS